MTDEETVSLGQTPEDSITPERYAMAVEQLEEFIVYDTSEINTLADLSQQTAIARSAIRDIIVSIGISGKYPISEISVPRLDGAPRIGILPGFYDYEYTSDTETIHLTVEQYGDDERLLLMKFQKTTVDLRSDKEEQLRILNIMNGYVPELIVAIKDAFRGFGLGDDLNKIVGSAIAEAVQEVTGGPSRKASSTKLNTIINGIIHHVVQQIEEGHSPMRQMYINMPVQKHFSECMPVELEAVDCMDSLGVFSPIDQPDNEFVHREFARVFQTIARGVLPTFPPPFYE